MSAPPPMAHRKSSNKGTREPMKKLTRIHLPLVIAVMAVFAVATPAQNLVNNLPDSDAVITINLRRIFSETLPRVLPAEQMTSFQATLAKAKQVAGFDVNNIDSAIVGLRFNRSA